MMKKLIAISGICLFILTSCTSSMGSDAEKLAKMQCQSFALLEKAGKGEVKAEESVSFAAEMELFAKEMEKKYASAQDKQKFEDACLKAIAAGCK